MTDSYKSRATTHADDCWSWGHGHYECAVRVIKALRERIQRDEVLLRQALDVLERGMRNPLLGRGVAAAIRERLHDKPSAYREAARAAIAKVELDSTTAATAGRRWGADGDGVPRAAVRAHGHDGA